MHLEEFIAIPQDLDIVRREFIACWHWVISVTVSGPESVLILMYNFRSPANILVESVMLCVGKGPCKKPWGTPLCTYLVILNLWSITTLIFQPVRKILTQSSSLPVISNILNFLSSVMRNNAKSLREVEQHNIYVKHMVQPHRSTDRQKNAKARNHTHYHSANYYFPDIWT